MGYSNRFGEPSRIQSSWVGRTLGKSLLQSSDKKKNPEAFENDL